MGKRMKPRKGDFTGIVQDFFVTNAKMKYDRKRRIWLLSLSGVAEIKKVRKK